MFRVLIADDDAGFRQAVAGLLQTRFPTTDIREAGDAQETLQQLDSVDLLLLDISLPQQSGLQLAAKIKSERPDLVVSILTIHDSPEYRQAAFQYGADYFVAKGAPAEQILKVVESAIAGKQTRSSPRPPLSAR